MAGHIRDMSCPRSCITLSEEQVRFYNSLFFSCLDIIIKQIYKDIYCLQMQKNGIYGMPKQVRHVTPAEFQLHYCLGAFPISLEPPEAQR